MKCNLHTLAKYLNKIFKTEEPLINATNFNFKKKKSYKNIN